MNVIKGVIIAVSITIVLAGIVYIGFKSLKEEMGENIELKKCTGKIKISFGDINYVINVFYDKNETDKWKEVKDEILETIDDYGDLVDVRENFVHLRAFDKESMDTAVRKTKIILDREDFKYEVIPFIEVHIAKVGDIIG